MDDILRRQAEAHRQNQARSAALRKTDDHATLVSVLEKKLLTTGIGALARFEAFFGRLWGEGKSEDELTENEIAWRRHFQDCRDEILDCANQQIRGMKAEMNLHEVEKTGQTISFRPVNNRK